MRDAGDEGKPNVMMGFILTALVSMIGIGIMQITSVFGLWITPIVARPTEIPHPAATLD